MRRLRPVLCVAAFAAVAAGGVPAAVPNVPAIYVNYSADCTFTMSVDGGTTVTSSAAPGPTLPPGTYQLLIWLANPIDGYVPCGRPVFTFTGPGVSSVTEFRGQELLDERIVTLQPSATYVARDEYAPVETRKVFTTAASGSSSSLLAPAVTTTTGTPQTSVQPALIGSAVLRYRGKLVARVGAAGTVTLTRGGRKPVALKAGRYDIQVDDAATRAGFFVQHGSRKPVAVTGLAFVGRRTRRVALTAGAWTWWGRPGAGTPGRFNVVP